MSCRLDSSRYFIYSRLLSLIENRGTPKRGSKAALYPPPPSTIRWRLVFPPLGLCTDNGVMAAWAGVEKLNLGISDSAEDQEPVARWPLGTPIERPDGVFKRKEIPKVK